jgi:hypothetical protein
MYFPFPLMCGRGILVVRAVCWVLMVLVLGFLSVFRMFYLGFGWVPMYTFLCT